MVPTEVLTPDYPVMIVLVALFAMGYGFRAEGRVSRADGAVLLSGYAAYMVVLYIDAT